MISKAAMTVLGMTLGALAVVGSLQRMAAPSAASSAAMAAACEGGALRNVQARNQAMEDGYVLNREHDCIDKASFQAVQTQKRAGQVRQADPAPLTAQNLADARKDFATQVAFHDAHPLALPSPPPDAFVRVDYTSAQGLSLPAFVTPNPNDGQRHPAIVWLTGGDTNSLSDFWTPGPPANDQTASAFRRAGVVMMFPVLRGGNTAAGQKQFFYGEVDDVLAAAQALARLPHVDPAHIYLGGHSTGGTLALLTAESRVQETSQRFRAVFALGPAADVARYGPDVLPVSFATLPPMEARLRSPIHWLQDITQPTYLIEGKDRGNTDSLSALCAAATPNPLVHCFEPAGLDHLSVVDVAARLIAAKIVQAHMMGEFALAPDAFEHR